MNETNKGIELTGKRGEEMKRYDFEQQHGELGQMRLESDGEWIRYEDHVEAMKRIAGASAQQAQPVGWKLVPNKATPEMLEELTNGDPAKNVLMKLRYEQMLIAAPAPTASPADQVEDARDAKRYRWLKEDRNLGSETPWIAVGRIKDGISRFTYEYADLIIDRAIAAKEGNDE